MLRNVIKSVLDILSSLVRVGVDDDTGLLSLAIVRGDRLNFVDGRNHAARQIIDERIARDLQRLEDGFAPLRTNHLRNRLRVVRAKEILQAQLLERGAILEIADVERNVADLIDQRGDVRIVVVRNADIGEVVTGPVVAVESNIKIGFAIGGDNNVFIFVSGNSAEGFLQIRGVVARKQI